MCELHASAAQIAEHLSVLRGVRSASPDHVYDEVFTAFPRGTPRPAFGSLVSRFSQAPASGLPAYVGLSRPLPVERPLYAGARHAPFRLRQEAIADLGRTVDLPCLQNRQALLHGFDTLRRDLDAGAMAEMDQYTARAFDILTADKIGQAFDLAQEPDKVRELPTGQPYTPYSRPSTWDASNLLLARRLVERGVRVVTLWLSSWDQHGHLFRSMDGMLPLLDRSIYALVTDLRDADWIRTWRWWSSASSAGRPGSTTTPAGITGTKPAVCCWRAAVCAWDRSVGATDSHGERSQPADPLSEHLCHAVPYFGHRPRQTLPDMGGRPLPLLDDLAPIAELV